jgi:hypothetical protein
MNNDMTIRDTLRYKLVWLRWSVTARKYTRATRKLWKALDKSRKHESKLNDLEQELHEIMKPYEFQRFLRSIWTMPDPTDKVTA